MVETLVWLANMDSSLHTFVGCLPAQLHKIYQLPPQLSKPYQLPDQLSKPYQLPA